MIYEYDKEVDILTISLRDHIGPGDITDSEEFRGGLVAEYGEDGNLIQIELRNARRVMSDTAATTAARAA